MTICLSRTFCYVNNVKQCELDVARNEKLTALERSDNFAVSSFSSCSLAYKSKQNSNADKRTVLVKQTRISKPRYIIEQLVTEREGERERENEL